MCAIGNKESARTVQPCHKVSVVPSVEREPARCRPFPFRVSNSSKKDGRCTTTPGPMSPVTVGLTNPTTPRENNYQQKVFPSKLNKILYEPLGNRWNANVICTRSGPIGAMIVCPALFPPAKRAQMSTSADSISTSLPLPSSPHCAPRTAVTTPITIH